MKKNTLAIVCSIAGLATAVCNVQAGPPDLRLPQNRALPHTMNPANAPAPLLPPRVQITPFPMAPGVGIDVRTPLGSGGIVLVSPSGVSVEGKAVITLPK